MLLSSVVLGEAIPSAQKPSRKIDRGEYRYLGYIIRLGLDCALPFGRYDRLSGLAERVSRHQVALALLPINGRGKGVPGNFTFDEAVQLCQVADIPYLIPHHFGMFAFNTVDRKFIEASVKQVTFPVSLLSSNEPA